MAPTVHDAIWQAVLRTLEGGVGPGDLVVVCTAAPRRARVLAAALQARTTTRWEVRDAWRSRGRRRRAGTRGILWVVTPGTPLWVRRAALARAVAVVQLDGGAPLPVVGVGSPPLGHAPATPALNAHPGH